MKKKILASVLLLGMAISLVACGGKKNSMKKGEVIKVEGAEDYCMSCDSIHKYTLANATLDEKGIFDLNQMFLIDGGSYGDGTYSVSAEFAKGASDVSNLTDEEWGLLLQAISVNITVNGESRAFEKNITVNPGGKACLEFYNLNPRLVNGDVLKFEVNVNEQMLEDTTLLMNAKGYTWHDVEYVVPEYELPVEQQEEVAAPEAALEEAAPEAALEE